MSFMDKMANIISRMTTHMAVQPRKSTETADVQTDLAEEQDQFENDELKAAAGRDISTTPTIRSTPELRQQENLQIHAMGALSDGPTRGPAQGEGISGEKVVNMPLNQPLSKPKRKNVA